MVITVSEVYVMELDSTKWNHDKESQPYSSQHKLDVLTYCTGCGDDVKSAYWLVVLFPRAFWVAQLLLLRPLISHALEGMRCTWAYWQGFRAGVAESPVHFNYLLSSLSPVLSLVSLFVTSYKALL